MSRANCRRCPGKAGRMGDYEYCDDCTPEVYEQASCYYSNKCLSKNCAGFVENRISKKYQRYQWLAPGKCRYEIGNNGWLKLLPTCAACATREDTIIDETRIKDRLIESTKAEIRNLERAIIKHEKKINLLKRDREEAPQVSPIKRARVEPVNDERTIKPVRYFDTELDLKVMISNLDFIPLDTKPDSIKSNVSFSSDPDVHVSSEWMFDY